ncbi:hypothetical protein BZG02_14735 [Labilibaculum filiforme]|uniref:TonB C-terminal domain-containing protein n=1 Tax=Labilibaculum filiforme TaxID=1940526 RepID=A0A2N3HV15_9BACT|nr:hypothetical protein [Labilibaculum filiforme]PKQ61878.1 hypothetical protein BZG02_14735 [Labilibaculum filiforme]
MKTIKIAFFALACLFLTANLGMATTPIKSKIEKEKILLMNKIRKAVAKTNFVEFMEIGKSELIVLRCTINENNQVVVSKVIGFDDELKEAVRKTMKHSSIMASSNLVGEELALQVKFKVEKQ